MHPASLSMNFCTSGRLRNFRNIGDSHGAILGDNDDTTFHLMDGGH